MKRRFSYTFAASTLVEMLIVIIVSGILFIALFDGVNLVRRYTNRLNKMLAAGNSLLDSYQQLDHLFLSCDSVTASTGIFCFYKGGERLALVVHRDSLLVCTRSIGVDTLFREVEEIRIVPVWNIPCWWIVLGCVLELGENLAISSSEGLGGLKTNGGPRY